MFAPSTLIMWLVSIAYSIGAVLGFYVLLTRLRFSQKSLPKVEETSWLLAMFLFSMALWANSRLAFLNLGTVLGSLSISEVFYLMAQGALTLFLLRLALESPKWQRYGGFVVLLVVAIINILLIKYVITAEIGIEGEGIFGIANTGLLLAQVLLALIPIINGKGRKIRIFWGVFAAGVTFSLLSELVGTGWLGNTFGILAAGLIGIYIPSRLVYLERRGKWPSISRVLSENEMHIALVAFGVITYLLIFTVYFYSESIRDGIPELQDNLMFVLSSSWLYILFAALVSYAGYRHNREEEREALENSRKELDRKVKERTRELERQLRELERFERLVIGREERMIELKREIARLKRRRK